MRCVVVRLPGYGTTARSDLVQTGFRPGPDLSWVSIMSSRPTPHSVKRWPLQGTDYAAPRDQVRAPGTLFSSWTPLTNKTHNLQLFEKRVELLLHWFDLWTDEGTRQLLSSHLCVLYQSPDHTLPDCLRALEPVADMGLFLFSDALVLTRLDQRHVPFTVTQTRSHSFMASVALSGLSVREVNHSRCRYSVCCRYHVCCAPCVL
uniref:Uncharacterized protein n=1 Tax=Knipowitschia caucasica TaxID=637954 RepID=A0AAV2L921_KNICA